MDGAKKHGPGFWVFQATGWALVVYLVYAQALSAFSYDLGVAMGTQEPVETITEVGAAFWHGFAVGDILVYIPLLCAGLVGQARRTRWGGVVLATALGITVYWPVVSLAALVSARGAAGWKVPGEAPYWIVCLLIASWGLWGLGVLVRDVRS